MTYAKRVDSNHSLIVKALRDMGCSVFDTSRVAGGFPDLVVGKNSKTALVEIKKDDKAKFTAAQQMFMLNWQGSTVCRIHDIEGAINLVKTLEKS
jgi:Holliday junction resolvase